MGRFIRILLAATLLCAPAFARGGGGGGHGGGHGGGGHSHAFIYIPVYTSPGVAHLSAAMIASYARIHNVGIISAIGTNLALFKHVGFLNNDSATRNIRDWNLDDAMAARLVQLLSSRFNLVKIPLNAAFDPAIFADNKEPLRKFLRGLNRSDLDAYLVIRPAASWDGAGTGLNADFTFPDMQRLTANYEIDLIDAKTFEVIASAGSRLRFHAGEAESFPVSLLPGRIVVDDKLALSGDSLLKLKRGFTAMLNLTALETVRALNFGAALPRPGDRVLVPIAPDKLPMPQIHSVAVVSALGDQMTLTYHRTLWRHGATIVPVSGWTLDSQVEAAVAASLDKRFVVKPASGIDRAKLAKLNAWTLYGSQDLRAKNLVPSTDVDAYILVLKQNMPVGDPDPDSGMRPDDAAGVGLWRVALSETNTDVFANYTTLVVDARTLTVLKMWNGVPGAQSPEVLAETPVADDTWPDGNALSPGQETTVHGAIADLMADSIPETLLQMGLTGMVETAAPPMSPTTSPAPVSAIVTTATKPD